MTGTFKNIYLIRFYDNLDQFENWKSQNRNCPWSWNNISKLCFTSLLSVLSLLELILFGMLTQNEDVIITGADFVSSGSKFITYILCIVLILNAKKAGRIASVIQFVFWFLLAICQGFTFGSVVNHDLYGLTWRSIPDV